MSSTSARSVRRIYFSARFTAQRYEKAREIQNEKHKIFFFIAERRRSSTQSGYEKAREIQNPHDHSAKSTCRFAQVDVFTFPNHRACFGRSPCSAKCSTRIIQTIQVSIPYSTATKHTTIAMTQMRQPQEVEHPSPRKSATHPRIFSTHPKSPKATKQTISRIIMPMTERISML